MLSELYFKKVRVKNEPGHFTPDGYHYEKKLMVREKESKPKKIKTPKWVDKLAPKPKTRQEKRKGHISPQEWMLMELKQKRAKLNAEMKELKDAAGIKLKREILKSEFEAFYKKYPKMKPEASIEISPTKKVDCSNPRYDACNMTVYTYKNGNRKNVIWEKMPPKPKASKKTKGVADGCNCYL
jgi:hypothetical protein